MNSSKTRLFLATFVSLAFNPVQAANYYVDPVNGNDSNPGTIGQPWRTIQRSVRYLGQYRQPGDIVYLRGGVYSGNAHAIDINGSIGALSGTQDAPITVKAYPGETPIVSDTTTGYRGVIIKNLNWWVFDGITYQHCYQSVWMENCTHVVWQNCTFGEMPSADSTYANFNFIGKSQFNTVKNCTFTRWGMVTSTGNDHGVSISIGNETTDDEMWYNLIENNVFLYGGHDHFQLNTAYNVIRGNLFVNPPWMSAPNFPNLPSIGGVPVEPNPYGLYGNRWTKPGDGGTYQIDMRNVFEHNVFLYTGPPPDDYGAMGIVIGTMRSIYRFNVFAFSLAAAVDFDTSGTTTLSTKNTFYGNVVYGNGLSHIYGGQGMKDRSYGITMSTFENRRTGNYIVNNIVVQNLPGNLEPNIPVYQELRGNLTDNAVDPRFVSTQGLGWHYNPAVLPDFHLSEGSPCIDAGTWLAYTIGAGSGTTMIVDNSLYFSDGNKIVAGDTIQLQGQTATSTVLENDWQNNTLHLSSPLTWTAGQGVSLAYYGGAPDQGAYEWNPGLVGGNQGGGAQGSPSTTPTPPSTLRFGTTP